MSAEITAFSAAGSDEEHTNELLRSVNNGVEQIKARDYIGAAMTFTWLSRRLHRLKRLSDAETAANSPRGR